MKNKLCFALCASLALACVCTMSACDIFEGSEELFGGGKSRDTVGSESSLWNPEDITEGEIVDNDSGSVGEGRIYFHEDKTKALLLDEFGGLTWLYAKDPSIFEPFDTGDYVRVSHGGVMLSYPGQTNISRLALIKDGNKSDFTEEELERIALVVDN